MANGQPLIAGSFNTATLQTSLSATGIPGGNKSALVVFGPKTGAGVVGRALGFGPGLLSSEVGVAGDSPTLGVFGQAGAGRVDDDQGNVLIAATGVAGRAGNFGIGVHGGASAGFGVLGQDPSGFGVQGKSVSGTGVAGDSQSGPGVSGRSQAQPGVRGESSTSQGVFGRSASSAGVAGVSTSFAGVFGRSTGNVGVQGVSTQSIGVYGSGQTEPGVRGDSNTAYGVLGMSTTGNGVHGWSTQGDAGVSGYSPAGNGMHAKSISGRGLLAESASGNAIVGLQTSAQAGSGNGVVGFAEVGVGVGAASRTRPSLYAIGLGSLAALFEGDVEVRGGFKVVGGPKSAVVKHRDGSHRQLYCMESPESWFEDFGEAVVAGGATEVALDPDFAALVRPEGYQVFLTPYDAASLYVSRRGAKGFEIRALPDAKGALPDRVRCGYRVVAKRLDIEAPRLAKVALVDAPRLELPKAAQTRPDKAPKKMVGALREPKERAEAKVPPAPKPLDKALLARRSSR